MRQTLILSALTAAFLVACKDNPGSTTTTSSAPVAPAPVAATPTPPPAPAYTPPTKAFVPAGFAPTPELSKTRGVSFKDTEYVLKDNTDYQAVIETDKGRMVLDLFENDVPVTVNNFVFLARHHFYDGVVFHRIIPDFMAQTGDPDGLGTGGPGYQFGDEIRSNLTFDSKYLLAMANAGPGTNGSQFFITFAPATHLNGKHTIFGKLLEGEAALNALEKGEPPVKPSVMLKVYIVEKKQ